MKFKTHLTFGLFLTYAEVQNKFLFILFVMLGSGLPDIDNASSKLGSKIWPLSKLIEIFLGHRGIFHSIWLIILIPGIVYLYLSKIYGIALFIGYFSHVLMDGFTKKGVNFLNPLLSLFSFNLAFIRFPSPYCFLGFLMLLFPDKNPCCNQNNP